MMNAELAAANESRIIIPTKYRSNYLEGLSLMSNHGNPDTLIKTLEFGQRYVHSFDWSNFDQSLDVLKKTNAFMRPEEGDRDGIRLRLPRAADFAPDNDENDGGDGSGGGASGGVSRTQRGARASSKKSASSSERQGVESMDQVNQGVGFAGQLRRLGTSLWSGLMGGGDSGAVAIAASQVSGPERLVQAVEEIIAPVLDQHLAEIRVFRRGGGGGGEKWQAHRVAFEKLATELDDRYLRGNHLLMLAAQKQLDRLGSVERQEMNLLPSVMRAVSEEPLEERRVLESMKTYSFEDVEKTIFELQQRVKRAVDETLVSVEEYPSVPRPGKTIKERALDLKEKLVPDPSFDPGLDLRPKF
ncbi:hypothetical protein EV129_112170 [Rhizobium azibense]|uniref:Uncharacterized protein n=2 Tax=Rhizobium azibense TaxID=1136135 RepID=A0A4R3RG24_9HYPH|nr:hypothetical protein [Rhizobium azibense]TCU34553.1 hypothetical protein EV129_112170 [Rhizobium azibense]